MKKLLLYLMTGCICIAASAQLPCTELYELIKKLLSDSTDYENVGDWGVGQSKKFSIKWKADQIEISDATSINFYRLGTADINIKGRNIMQGNQLVKWNIMLKEPWSGYTSFSNISSPSGYIKLTFSLDSLIGKKNFSANCLKHIMQKPSPNFITTT